MKLPHLCLFLSSAASAAMLAPATLAQTLMRSVNGPSIGARYGKACIRVSDQNGDAYDDVLVGAPSFNSQRGAVFCISGTYLAFGTGVQTLWSVTPAVNAGDQFGSALAEIGDVNNDGVGDFLVGQPGYDFASASDVGAVRVINGSSHTVLSLVQGERMVNDPGAGCRFGSAFAACGDWNNDGVSEVVVGAPGSASPYLRLLDGASLAFSQANNAISQGTVITSGSGGNDGLGTAITSGFDINGDGYQEFVVSEPGFDSPSAPDSGNVALFSRTVLGLTALSYYTSAIPGERFGQTLDSASDYDGDGFIDIVVGAPNSPDSNGQEAGRVVVLSGFRFQAHSLPYEIRTLTLPFFSTLFDYHFGAAVRATGDLNNDGVGDILAGAPDYTSVGAGGSILNKGLLAVFSGATGSRCATITGSSGDVLGDAIAGAIGDLDGDGFEEFVFAGSLSDAGGTDSGVVKCYRLFPVAPAAYCTGKINSLGCTPAISFTGSPMASPTAPFVISANNFINQKTGLLFYSHKPATTAFQGGFKCAGDPVSRTEVLNSGGSTSGSSCTGTYSFDFNARIQNAVDPSLVAGAEIYAQYWSRDPLTASTTSLSNALRFLINP